jgi:hypothetical protein
MVELLTLSAVVHLSGVDEPTVRAALYTGMLPSLAVEHVRQWLTDIIRTRVEKELMSTLPVERPYWNDFVEQDIVTQPKTVAERITNQLMTVKE